MANGTRPTKSPSFVIGRNRGGPRFLRSNATDCVPMAEVTLGEGDRLDVALKAFKRKVMRSGILKDLRKKRFYVKPSTAKRLKAAAARRRVRADLRRAQRRT